MRLYLATTLLLSLSACGDRSAETKRAVLALRQADEHWHDRESSFEPRLLETDRALSEVTDTAASKQVGKCLHQLRMIRLKVRLLELTAQELDAVRGTKQVPFVEAKLDAAKKEINLSRESLEACIWRLDTL